MRLCYFRRHTGLDALGAIDKARRYKPPQMIVISNQRADSVVGRVADPEEGLDTHGKDGWFRPRPIARSPSIAKQDIDVAQRKDSDEAWKKNSIL